jgi:hypothetical protein
MSGARERLKGFSEIISRMIREKKWEIRFERGIIWKNWEKAVGGKIAGQAFPIRFQERDTLIVAVSDSIWMHQLSFQKIELIKAINGLLKEKAWIKDIRFLIGDVEGLRKEWTMEETPFEPSESLQEETLKKADELVKEIEDLELRNALRGMYLRSLKNQKS